MKTLPCLLARPGIRRPSAASAHGRLQELRKIAAFWQVPNSAKVPRERIQTVLEAAWKDPATAARVVASLNEQDQGILAVYRRYGPVNGHVIRLDLLTRGLLEIVRETRSPYYTRSTWRRDGVKHLAERGALLLPDGSLPQHSWSHSYGYGEETERALTVYGLHPALADVVQPAGPPPPFLKPTNHTPEPLGGLSPTEVALGLSRLLAAVEARSPLKLTRLRALPVRTLQSLAKQVPLPEDPDFPLPDLHGLYFEVLRGCGLVRVAAGEATADPVAATEFFARSAAVQAFRWARSWLDTPFWGDGLGAVTPSDADLEGRGPTGTARQVLAWVLGSLASAEEDWFSLSNLLDELYQRANKAPDHAYSWSGFAWDPKLPAAQGRENKSGAERQRAYWFDQTGRWYANALLVTLPALGLVERGRLTRGEKTTWAFRLTPLGRAIFGAPAVPLPPDEEAQRFLVVQPNFDVVAYLDRADVTTAATLGRLVEVDAETGRSAGPVQVFRLTRGSVYRALEGGLSQASVEEFLRRHNQGELPRNVLHSLAEWAGRREGLVLRSEVTLLAFPTAEARTDWLAGHPGTACGERFVLVPKETRPRGIMVVDHARGGRPTMTLDEHGRLHVPRPLDLVQTARLRRLADSSPEGWRLTAGSLQRAASVGLKSGRVHAWLHQMLAAPAPPLMVQAIDAWLGQTAPVELAGAQLLHVPDPERFTALASSPRLRRFLAGTVGPGWLLVRPEGLAELRAVLEELGFGLGYELTPEALPPLGTGD